MSVTFRVMLSFLVWVVPIGATAKRTTAITGRIIAYRPVDRVAQVPSFAPNVEIFLFLLEDKRHANARVIVKLEYRHFGYTNIMQDVLERAPRLTLKVKRNRACDESYGHFLDVAPTLREEKSGEVTLGGVTFLEEFRALKPSRDAMLECYSLDADGIQVPTNMQSMLSNSAALSGGMNMSERPHGLTAILIVMVLSVSNLSSAQQSSAQEKEAFWVNLPSSPLRIALGPNQRDLELRNHSSGVVTGYQLGCVTEESGKIRVQSRFESVEMKNELGPPDPHTGKLWFTVSDLKYRDLCNEKKARLAVVSVSFADGSQWMIKQ